MPIVTFSKRDLLQGKTVSPAWYRCKVETVGEEPSKDQGSTNYPVDISILFDGDNGNVEFKDVPVKFNFNSKAIGMAVPFLTALGVPIEAEKRIDLKAAEGMTLDIYIGNKTYEGRIINDVKAYRMPKGDVSAVA
jgi:hypothetical protein